MKMRTDEQIKTDVVADLAWDDRIDATAIEVSVENSEVTLKGSVNSLLAKRVAEENTWTTMGVLQVDNQLEVEYPEAVEVPTDEEIDDRVTSKYQWDLDLRSFKLDVDVNAGLVELTGSVNSLWKKYHAETLAENVTGVLAVTNKIAVVPSEDYTDEAIAEDITATINRRLDVNVNNVDVTVEDGKVTLSGSVADWAAWRSALDAALYTLGAVEVEDNLNIVQE
jgi:osmotically-inducible protein OsmY